MIKISESWGLQLLIPLIHLTKTTFACACSEEITYGLLVWLLVTKCCMTGISGGSDLSFYAGFCSVVVSFPLFVIIFSVI